MNPTGAASTPLELDYKSEVWRKLLHLFALVIPIGYHLVPRAVAVACVLFAFLVSLLIDLARIRSWPIQSLWTPVVSPIVRPKESHAFTGASHILLSGWLCPLLFSIPAASLAMTCIILGDSAAALVGRRWGRHRYSNGSRSLEGSTAFFLASIIAALVVPGIPLWIGLAGALLATIVEALSTRVDDNLSVPLLVGLFAQLSLRLLAYQ